MNEDANGTKVRKAKMLEALRSTLGVVSSACAKVGIERSLYYQWMNKDEEFKKEVEALKDFAIDFVETQMFYKIKHQQDPSLIKYYLGTQARHRGYVDRQEIDHRVPDQITVNIVHGNQSNTSIPKELGSEDSPSS